MAAGEQPMKVLIVGAGAIGTYIGCSLYQAGSDIVYLEKSQLVADLKKGGLHLTVPGQVITIPDPQITASIDQALELGPFDTMVFALKSFDTNEVAQDLSPYKERLPPVLCLQNGVDNERLLATHLRADDVIAGTVTSSVFRRAVGDIVLERKRGVGIANTHPLSSRLYDTWDRAGLNPRLYERPLDMKWSKLITNLLGNAISAILDMTPSQVFAHPGLFRMERAQIRETLKVMNTQGIQVADLPATPVRLLSTVIKRFPIWLAQPLLQRSLGAGRGGKMPSLHIDLQSGRKFSEVEDLNGAIVRYGRNLAIATPTNELLYQTLVRLVNGEVPWSDFQKQPQRLLDLWHR